MSGIIANGWVVSGLILGAALIALAFYVNRPQFITIDAEISEEFPDSGFSHLTFESLLRKYVDKDGLVDYGRWHISNTDRHALDQYLAAVSAYSPKLTPNRFDKRSDALAYWLYSYNAYVIRSILQNWPLESVTDVKAPLEAVKGLGFFYWQRFIFGKEAHSLYAVENDIIRRQYKDPRIHFVLNCASASCPVLKPELPTGDELEKLLQDSTLEFISDSRNVRVDAENRRIVVSTIFKWYEKDFINDVRRGGSPADRGIVDYITAVAPPALRSELVDAADFEIEFADYDWAINSQQ